MKRKFIPLGDRILVLPDSIPVKKTGLLQPQAQMAEPTEGIVMAVGEDAVHDIRNSDRIQFAKYAGREVMLNGVKHKLLRLEEVEGVIEDVDE